VGARACELLLGDFLGTAVLLLLDELLVLMGVINEHASIHIVLVDDHDIVAVGRIDHPPALLVEAGEGDAGVVQGLVHWVVVALDDVYLGQIL